VAAKKFAPAVDADVAYGEKIGVRSTPTFFVNGQLIAGAVPVEQFSEVIDDELANKK
jgi:protein-disulfide isomerase